MMRIADVPPSLRHPLHNYPPHNTNVGIEVGFGLHAKTATIRTEAIYLPIYWTNNYHAQGRRMGSSQLRAIPEVDAYLEILNPNEQYFTITQGAEGIYETVPDNLFVFSSGGVGDEPIPLLCSPHPLLRRNRDMLASFMGVFNPGAPAASDSPPRQSSSDPNGVGTRIRRKMQEIFSPMPNCSILRWVEDIQPYRELTARSRFGLAPRGYGRTSFRLYEMFSMGTVPVYIYNEPWLPYRDQLEWETFCVLCPESELLTLPERLLSIGDTWWNEARRQASVLFNDYFTIAGTCRQIARMVEERW